MAIYDPVRTIKKRVSQGRLKYKQHVFRLRVDTAISDRKVQVAPLVHRNARN